MKVLILAPAFPPSINGLGDYALKVGKGLREKGVEVVYAGLEKQASVLPYFQIQKNEKWLHEIIHEQQIQTLLINFSAFGYDASGLPTWLLKQLQLLDAAIKKIIFFHELHASSNKPWQKIFWTSKYQQKIIQHLANTADTCLVSCEVMDNHLKNDYKILPSKIIRTGLFSNITPPKKLMPWEERKNQIVVFGTKGRREAVYNRNNVLKTFLAQHHISTLIDIGEADIHIPVSISNEIKIEKLNNVEAKKISECLNQSKYAAISYPNHLLGKSGIFAAYAAHGNVVFNFDNSVKYSLDELLANQHFLNTAENNVDISTCSSEIIKWYSQRNFQQHLQKISPIIEY